MLRRFAAAILVLLPLAALAETSADCRSCHDGKQAVKMDVGHPVEIDYAKVQKAAPARYRPQPPAEMLVNGRVECASCHFGHDVQTRRDHRLRADVISLCTSCHIVE